MHRRPSAPLPVRAPRGLVLACLSLAVLLAVPRPASAQLGGGRMGRSATVLEHVRVLTGTGTAIDDATVVIARGRIVAVGASGTVGMPGRTRTVDATGLVLAPGLVDADAGLGLVGGGSAGPLNRAIDAFDRYDTDALEQAWRSGVTTVYLPARGGAVSGTGAVVRLARTPQVADDAAALHVDLDSAGDAIERLQRLEGIRRQMRDALAWRESVEIYEEDLLPEYEKKLKERAEKRADGEDVGGVDTGGSARPTPPPAPGGDARRSGRRGRGGPPGGGRGGPRAGAPGGGPPAAARGGRGGGGGDELKKPQEPRPNRAAEVVLRAIDGEIPVRVAAHRSADILNAIELAEEFGLRLVVEGGHEAGLVAEALADAGAAVVLGPATGASADGAPRWTALPPDAIAALDAAGVPWSVGSGASGGTPFLLMNAQVLAGRATAAGTDPLHVVSARAADLLGLADHGTIERGSIADVVLWSADPHDPAARVVAVMVDGRTVHGELPQ